MVDELRSSIARTPSDVKLISGIGIPLKVPIFKVDLIHPERVTPNFLLGAYVVDDNAATKLKEQGFALPINVEPMLFFRETSS
jgi:hypothetical protein